MRARGRGTLSVVAVTVATVMVLGGGFAAIGSEPPAEPSVTPAPNPFVEPPSGNNLDTDDDGRLTVEVYLDGPESRDTVRASAPYFDVTASSDEFAVLAGTIPVEKWDDIQNIPGVRSVTTPPPPIVGGHGLNAFGSAHPITATIPAPACRSVPVEADAPLSAAQARDVFGVDGTGVTVGIISDSFAMATGAVTTPADDVQLGSLPGAGNPCGYTTAVTVVRDADTSDSGVSDEGRAMAQLVHGIAPGARLLFANAGQSMYEMADAVDLLVAAGADIIVDDISFYSAPMYQQGPVDSAIARAMTQGVSHYSSAGNSSRRDSVDGSQIGSWASSDFASTACPTALAGQLSEDGCMNFGTATDPDPTNRVSYSSKDGTADLSLILQWAEPWYAVEAPLALVALSTGSDPQVVGFGICANTSAFPAYTCDQSVATLTIDQANVGATVEFDLVVVRVRNTGVAPGTLPSPGIRMQVLRSGGELALEHNVSFTDATHTVVVGPTVSVNNAGPNVFTVGAAAYDDPGELREYSAFGPYGHLFEPLASAPPGTPAAALTTPWTRTGPDAVSVDGTRTSFFGGGGSAGEYRFHGTSAAAPHAAAIAALVRAAHQKSPLTVVEEFAVLRGSTSPVATTALGPSVDPAAAGGGLIDAADALASSGAATDARWASPVPPDEVPPTRTDLMNEPCANCSTGQLAGTVTDGILTVYGGASSGVQPGDWAWLFAYSSPANLGWVRFGPDLSFAVDVSALPTGDHVLALFRGTRQVVAGQSILIGRTPFTVPDDAIARPAGLRELADSGSELSTTWGVAVLALLTIASGTVLTLRRRRRA